MTHQLPIKAVLFDLDGTLLYSAYELGSVANRLRATLKLPPLPINSYEEHIGNGTKAILTYALQQAITDNEFDYYKEKFLDCYQQIVITNASRLYHGVGELLNHLQQQNCPWGVVTNKNHQYTAPIITNTPALTNAACVISGDTLTVSKPHPQPLLLAAKQLKVPPQQCLYVGDHCRDMQAAENAAMPAAFAAYGYTKANNAGQSTYKNVINNPLEVIKLI